MSIQISSIEATLNRTQFFIEIYRLSAVAVKYLLLATAFITLVMRLIDTELAVKVAAIATFLVFPVMIVMVMKSISRVLDLHRYLHEGKEGYVEPNLGSITLLPSKLMVSIGIIAPPLFLDSLLFGLGNYPPEHTEKLNILLLFQLTTVWYYWVFEPIFKKVIVQQK